MYSHLGVPYTSLDLDWDTVQLRSVATWLHLNSPANIVEDDHFFREHQAKVPTRKAGQAPITQFKKPAKAPVLAFVWPGPIWERIEEAAEDLKDEARIETPKASSQYINHVLCIALNTT